MLQLIVGLLLQTALSAALPPAQHVLDIYDASIQPGPPRKLQGRFLHITDIHPDPFYKIGTDPDGEHPCHKGDGRAGYFGAEATDCDSPFTLVNATFDWIRYNIKDDIDFVIWTGDSARHDNDEKHPRTSKQVEELNNYIVDKFDEVFGVPDKKHDRDPTNDFVIPIVPNFGNNDILPHNIFEPGPNKWTKKYLEIWNKFIPQEQRHSFARGGWFFTEVIPNRLAVFSLNTLYFFDSNGAVDGCYDPNEPGYEHFEWLRIQLQFLRERKMKAILMGHVPPARTQSKQNWDETCYQKYTLWLRQYRDVVVGNIFGHMNLDHFVLQDMKELKYKFKIPGIDDGSTDHSSKDDLHAEAKVDYLSDLRELWGNLPRTPKESAQYEEDDAQMTKKGKKKSDKYLKAIGGKFGERFSLSVVSPSVVPNFYPTLRIVEYNISGLETESPASHPTSPQYADVDGIQEMIEDDDIEAEKKKKKKHKKPKPNFSIPDPPSKASLPGPAYSPQTFSFLSWKQYYANLTKINELVEEELATYPPIPAGWTIYDGLDELLLKKHFMYELEYDTQDDKVYKMKDLTMRHWLALAEKIARTSYDPASVDEMTPDEESSDEHISDDSVRPTSSDGFEEGSEEEYDEEEAQRICLEWQRRYRESRMARWSPPDDPSWPAWMIRAVNERMQHGLNVEDATVDFEEDDEGYGSLEDEEFDSADDSGIEDVDAAKKKKKKKKKKGKKRKDKTLKKNKLWHTFVKRAFVGTKTDEDLESEFG